MAHGGGKYEETCTLAREHAAATGVLLIVLGGKHGDGFSVQIPRENAMEIPALLRTMADQIENDIRNP